MSKTAFLFPGQGSQSLGMLSAMAEEYTAVMETFAQASTVLGYDLWEVCQNGPEERLNHTETTQPAMLAGGIAIWRVWKELGGADPDIMAGHSLGEYSALVAAGVMDYKDAIGIVAQRGRLMQDATPEGVGAMAAILGLDDEVLAGVCTEQAGDEIVSCANFNSPGQVVIAGHRQAVERACQAATAAGARRAIMLPVSVPSHCVLMKCAGEQLSAELEQICLNDADIPVVQNADVKAYQSTADIIDALARQLWQPVQWAATILYLKGQGVERFIECGPGKVLAGLNRRTSSESETTALTGTSAINDALNWSQT